LGFPHRSGILLLSECKLTFFLDLTSQSRQRASGDRLPTASPGFNAPLEEVSNGANRRKRIPASIDVELRVGTIKHEAMVARRHPLHRHPSAVVRAYLDFCQKNVAMLIEACTFTR
jgi:hypothetical protein